METLEQVDVGASPFAGAHLTAGGKAGAERPAASASVGTTASPFAQGCHWSLGSTAWDSTAGEHQRTEARLV